MTFKELAKKIILEENYPLTITEIWQIAKEKGYDEKIASTGKTPDKTLQAQLYTEVKKISSDFYIYQKKPTKFFLRNLNIKNTNIPIKEESEEESIKHERELHKYLATFLRYNDSESIYAKTIFHEYSKKRKKGLNKWNFPDMVGFSYPFELEKDLLYISEKRNNLPLVIYSFEIKRRITALNLRENFFQTVSNSSWANESYLVVEEIDLNDRDLFNEIKRLSNSFGIGIIKLNRKNILESEFIFRAKKKNIIDIDTMNKLIEENKNFKEFITQIKNSLTTGEINESKFDAIFSIE